MQLDSTGWKILGLLQGDARMSNVELAKAVGLSPSPCLNRVRALEEAGYISRYVTLLDALRVGLKVSVFIQVTLERQIESALERFENAIRTRPEVMECYLMTGDADYLIRVVVADIQVLEEFILKFLTKLPGVGNIKSSFALKQVKYQTALPLPVAAVAPKADARRKGKNKRQGLTCDWSCRGAHFDLASVDAAVDVERGAGDEAVVLAGKKHGGARNVIGIAAAAERDAGHRGPGGLEGRVGVVETCTEDYLESILRRPNMAL